MCMTLYGRWSSSRMRIGCTETTLYHMHRWLMARDSGVLQLEQHLHHSAFAHQFLPGSTCTVKACGSRDDVQICQPSEGVTQDSGLLLSYPLGCDCILCMNCRRSMVSLSLECSLTGSSRKSTSPV